MASLLGFCLDFNVGGKIGERINTVESCTVHFRPAWRTVDRAVNWPKAITNVQSFWKGVGEEGRSKVVSGTFDRPKELSTAYNELSTGPSERSTGLRARAQLLFRFGVRVQQGLSYLMAVWTQIWMSFTWILVPTLWDASRSPTNIQWPKLTPIWFRVWEKQTL